MSEFDDHLDEDVVLSGPLHDYLRTCGDDGFSTSLTDALPSTSKDTNSASLKDYWRSNLIDVKAVFKSANLEQTCIAHVSDLIIHSNLIDSIDEHLIDEERVGDAGRPSSSSNSTAIWTSFGCAVLSSISTRFTNGRLFKFFAATATVSAAVSSVLVVSVLWQKLRLRFFKQHVSSYIAEQQAIDTNIGDAIRAIRQRQVVLYGLLSTGSETKQSHLSAERCFLPLRLALFSVLRSAILYTRDGTQRLAKRVCSVDEIRCLTSSSTESEFDSLLIDSSPPVDLVTIKAVWHWYYLLRSEYLRCLAWAMLRIGADAAEQSVCYMKREHANTTNILLERIRKMTAAGRSFDDDINGDGVMPQQRRFVSESSGRPAVVLQAIRLRLAIAQEWTDHLVTTCNENDQRGPELSLIEKALDEARDCLRELQSTDELNPPAESSSTAVAPAGRVPSPVASRIISADYEPTVDDQVFEAVARAMEEGADLFNESDQHAFASDDVVNKKTARSVLNELKTALVGRSEQMRQRERMALAQFRRVPLEQLIAEEEQNGNSDDDESTYSGDAEQSPSLDVDDLLERSALRSELAALLVGRFRQSGGVAGRDECRFEGTGDMIIEAPSSSTSTSDVES